MAESSLPRHMERSHGIVLPKIRGVDVIRGGTDTYKVLFPPILKLVGYPVEGCQERANTPGIFREHFMYRHWNSKVDIMQEVLEPLPMCDQFRMHIPSDRTLSTGI